MKILLVSCSFEDQHRNNFIALDSHYPLGLGMLHSCLERDGHAVRTLFLNDYPYINCAYVTANEIKSFNPDIVGINMLTHNRWASYMLINFLSSTYPGIKIILGGIHATVMAEQLIKVFPHVIIIKGEADISFGKLLNASPGIYEAEMPMELDSLPFVKHEAFYTPQRQTFAMLSSRGCPNQCTFCVMKNISQRKVRYRSPESVVAEMEYIRDTFPTLGRYWWEDDSATIDNERMIKICELMIQKGLNKYIHICSARVKPVSYELIDVMFKAGFRHILFGLESGSETILKSCKKAITTEEVTKCHEIMARFPGMMATYFLMVGLPGETEKTILETANFINKLQRIKPIHYEDIGVTQIYPGTEVYEIAKNYGIIDDNYWLTDNPVPFYLAENNLEETMRLKNLLLSRIRGQ